MVRRQPSPVFALILFACCGLAAARLEVNAHGVLHGRLHARPGDECTALKIELHQRGIITATACPHADGRAAAFAVPIYLPAPASRLALLTLTQFRAAQGETRHIRQLVDLSGYAPLMLDLRYAAVANSPDAALQAAAPINLASPAGRFALPGYASLCRFARPSYLDLEDAGDLCIPSFLALARRIMPFCIAPTTSTLLVRASTVASATWTDATLLRIVGAVCILQAAALSATLFCWRVSRRQQECVSSAGVVGAVQLPPPSKRDACTSPLIARLASPFVLHKPAEEACTSLEAVLEGDAEEAAAEHRHPDNSVTLVPAPVGWTRDAWGRLQRQLEHSDNNATWRPKAAAAAQHPPPFGSAPGTAYRMYTEE